MERWHALIRDGETEQQLGPVAFAELVQLYEMGRLKPSDLVWQPDFASWRAACEVGELSAPRPAAAEPAGQAWPSDALPLWILAGIVLCFVLHFSQRRFTQAAESESAPRQQAAIPPMLLEVEICNRTAEAKLYATVAYYDPLRRDWIARGWYPVTKDGCTLPLRNLKPPVFVYAESKDGGARFGDDAGVEFCIDGSRGFVLPQKDCDARGGVRRVAFHELKPKDGEAKLVWEPAP